MPVDPEAHPLCARKAQQTLMPVLQTQVKVESFETIMRTITTIMLSGDGVNFFTTTHPCLSFTQLRIQKAKAQRT